MGIFKKVFSLDKAKEPQEIIDSPLEGTIIPLTDVPDPVFSGKMMGDGFAINPTDGVVVSPVDGIITHIAETKHAIGIKTKKGTTMIIHFGLDTVNLEGKGFRVFVELEQKVKRGDKILEADMDVLKANVPSVITPVVFPELEEDLKVTVYEYRDVILGESNIACIKK